MESSKLRKTIMVLAILFAAVALSGCGASLTVYDYSEDGVRYNEYELKIDAKTVTEMERTAALDEEGNRYTVSGYFLKLFDDIFGYELVYAENTDDGGFIGSYRKAIADSEASELFQTGTEPEFDFKEKSDPFIRHITQTAANPFNGVREAYDNAPEGKSTTPIQKLKNGVVATDINNETVVQFPAITDAFPYLRGAELDGLRLNYARSGSDRMKSSGEKSTKGSTVWYTFSRYFDTVKEELVFEYIRPVPYGWYLVALLAGGITILIFILATRPKKQKPTLLDRFPYNPEQYRDYETHLPANK